MRLAISNIAWSAEHDATMLPQLAVHGFDGLEIAPTRIYPQNPYSRINDAENYAADLLGKYGLRVCSMQSIWFGRTERLFGSAQERMALVDYTKQAIDFSQAIGCKNLVFGNPKSRFQEHPELFSQVGIDFFREICEYALKRGTVIALEPNPEIYGTNFVTHTEQAFQLVRRIGNPAFRVNYDIGTVIANKEHAESLRGNLDIVHHVHLSEPGLEPIQSRSIHGEIADILRDGGYNGHVSIEMKNYQDTKIVLNAMQYLREVFA